MTLKGWWEVWDCGVIKEMWHGSDENALQMDPKTFLETDFLEQLKKKKEKSSEG